MGTSSQLFDDWQSESAWKPCSAEMREVYSMNSDTDSEREALWRPAVRAHPHSPESQSIAMRGCSATSSSESTTTVVKRRSIADYNLSLA
ncbi:hypothetical protein OE88DRAFT_1662808 [Heliocybe sulcata]|uniref:Uncharacterized protein n=1 Tax=Heliocybe sulcata TaxID=5364 RepID=A0A5C3MWS9_9AGAM|nr:hypothetical protein OE88DRAFT_1662808 [Heliocybe sulcata]